MYVWPAHARTNECIAQRIARHAHTCIHAHTSIHTHAHAHMHIHTCTLSHAHVHTHMHVWWYMHIPPYKSLNFQREYERFWTRGSRRERRATCAPSKIGAYR